MSQNAEIKKLNREECYEIASYRFVELEEALQNVPLKEYRV